MPDVPLLAPSRCSFSARTSTRVWLFKRYMGHSEQVRAQPTNPTSASGGGAPPLQLGRSGCVDPWVGQCLEVVDLMVHGGAYPAED